MGDYDVDGIVASAIMKMTLCHLGVKIRISGSRSVLLRVTV